MKKSATRDRILEAASRRFRQQGYADTGVAQLMRDVGLTHGGFYAHFPSKQDLFREAVRYATDQSGDRLESKLENLRGRAWIEAWVDGYLSQTHLEHIEQGCPATSLTPEIIRAGGGVCDAFAAGLDRRLNRICRHLPYDRPTSERLVLVAFAHMAGALMISRALDRQRADALRQDTARSVKAMLFGGGEVGEVNDSVGGQSQS